MSDEKPKLSDSDRKILSLESKIAGLLQDRSRMSRELKAAVTKHGIVQSVVEELQAVVTPLESFTPVADFRKSKKSTVEEHLVMHLSDEHADEVVKGHTVGHTEEFDFPIALCRAEQYVDSVLKFTQSTLTNYRFPVLHILNYGDHTSGEIHNATGHSYYRNMFRNCLAIGQMQAHMFRDLAPYFPRIEVVCLSGNHGRRSVKKDFNGPWDNWDYLVCEIAATYCRDLKNVRFHIPECFSLNYEINGHGFHI